LIYVKISPLLARFDGVQSAKSCNPTRGSLACAAIPTDGSVVADSCRQRFLGLIQDFLAALDGAARKGRPEY
jgi:hypothetical protein